MSFVLTVPVPTQWLCEPSLRLFKATHVWHLIFLRAMVRGIIHDHNAACGQVGQQFFRRLFLEMGPVHFVMVVACALLCAKHFASAFNEAVVIAAVDYNKPALLAAWVFHGS